MTSLYIRLLAVVSVGAVYVLASNSAGCEQSSIELQLDAVQDAVFDDHLPEANCSSLVRVVPHVVAELPDSGQFEFCDKLFARGLLFRYPDNSDFAGKNLSVVDCGGGLHVRVQVSEAIEFPHPLELFIPNNDDDQMEILRFVFNPFCWDVSTTAARMPMSLDPYLFERVRIVDEDDGVKHSHS